MSNARKMPIWGALIPLISMILLLGIGYGRLKLRSEPLLIISAMIAAIMGKCFGYTWKDMQKGIVDKIGRAVPAILIVISIGLVISSWLYSGTIPFLIFYGVKVISPRYIYLAALLVPAIVSISTGTSWGSAGTVGVAIIGIAGALDASMAITAGAVVSGSFFGDKLSPLSDTTNLASIATGANLYDHIKHMLYTTGPAFIIAGIIYTILGFRAGNTAAAGDPAVVAHQLADLERMFNLNILLIIPVLIVLAGSLMRKPTVPVMLLSVTTAVILGLIVQNYKGSFTANLKDAFTALLTGFKFPMTGVDPESLESSINRLLNRGGMRVMMNTTLISICAFSFAGILTATGSLAVILNALLKGVKSVFSLIVSTIVSCLTMISITGSPYLTLLIPGELFTDEYKRRKLAPENLSRTLEDAGTVIAPLVPWSLAGVYIANTLGVPTVEYLPFAFMNYLGLLVALFYAATGISIKKLSKEQEEA